MSEALIPRTSPEITVRTSEEDEYGLTYLNTVVCEFTNDYDYMNHVYVQYEGEMGATALFLFNQEELATALKENGYPLRTDPYPSDNDIEAYLSHQSNLLEQELEGDENE